MRSYNLGTPPLDRSRFGSQGTPRGVGSLSSRLPTLHLLLCTWAMSLELVPWVRQDGSPLGVGACPHPLGLGPPLPVYTPEGRLLPRVH